MLKQGKGPAGGVALRGWQRDQHQHGRVLEGTSVYLGTD